jgi:hypothetical protein
MLIFFSVERCLKLIRGKPKNKGGNPGRPFILNRCWEILENGKKWKNAPSNEFPNKRKAPSSSIGDGFGVDIDDDGSRYPTPLSSIKRGRPDGRKEGKNNRENGDEGVTTNHCTT